ncbi:MAG TPA: SGNH/GDSL hydrolase family protein [Planctomycetota bacterium]|nr:SGNH/GDSL hydrolase family protein [Planctomycetota bacterium]
MSPPRIGRRSFLTSTAAGAASLLLTRPAGAGQDAPVWHDVNSWGVEGKGWTDTVRPFDRFPSKAEKSVPPPVWNLSRHSAGMLVRFETDSPVIYARWSVLSGTLALPHMPATGVSGLDLYARDEQGRDRWLAVAKPTQQKMELKLAGPVDPLPGGKRRLYTVYLPLYNGTESLDIGVDAQASFEPVTPRREKPMVFYGTSILHGACASRPGMAFPAILGRRFNRPTINLGFSGNGRMEPEVGALLAELDPCLYAIDCLPNMTPEQVAERSEPLVRQLRKARPDVPILLVEDRSFTAAPFLKGSRDGHAARRAALRKAAAALAADGVKGLGYLEGDSLLGDDGEGATDGSHPSDLGMVRYADAYEKELKKLL